MTPTLPLSQEFAVTISHNERARRQQVREERVPQISHGNLKQLVFSIYKSIGRETPKFYSRLFDFKQEKQDLQASITLNCMQTTIYFTLLSRFTSNTEASSGV